MFISALHTRNAFTPWWMAGAIPYENVLNVYQPKGAASYAESKINLAAPGTRNALDGTAYPTWDATNGWKFNRANTQYLNSGITPAIYGGTPVIIVRFSGITDSVSLTNYITGKASVTTTDTVVFVTRLANIYGLFGSAATMSTTGAASGTAAVAYNGTQHVLYTDGVSRVSASSTFTAGGAWALLIGATRNESDGIAVNHLSGNIQAIAFYKSATPDQIIAVSNAMALL
jgi:hypothetical protein